MNKVGNLRNSRFDNLGPRDLKRHAHDKNRVGEHVGQDCQRHGYRYAPLVRFWTEPQQRHPLKTGEEKHRHDDRRRQQFELLQVISRLLHQPCCSPRRVNYAKDTQHENAQYQSKGGYDL